MPEPSAQLLARCSRGDKQAFAELVGQQQAFIYNLAYRLMGEAEEARDLAQEALLRVWQMLPSFRGEARFTTWLYRLVVNLGLNRLAHLRRSQASPMSDEHAPPAAAAAADPQTIEDERERREYIWQQVDALPEKYRLVITLYYQQERSYAEISQILQLPLNTVKTHLARARHLLASRLAGLREDAYDL
jgi:RNA polymerase sigma-70 factor (ECF subfamily)